MPWTPGSAIASPKTLKSMGRQFLDYVARHNNEVRLRDVLIAKGWRYSSGLNLLKDLERKGLAQGEVRHGHLRVWLTDAGLELAAELADAEAKRRNRRVRL